jgi:acyl carrier protein
MPPTPPSKPNPALARFPAEVLQAYQRYRDSGDAGAVDAVVIAAVIDYRPCGAGPAPAVSDETRLFEDLGYDSVAVAELVFFLEDIFDLTIANDDIVEVRTIGSLRECVTRKFKAGPPGGPAA